MVEDRRLAAAGKLRRRVKRLGPNVWRVLNRGRIHYVRGGSKDVVCDCEDNLFRGGEFAKCKHIRAVELKEGIEFKINPFRRGINNVVEMA